MVIYDSLAIYVESASSLKDRLAKIYNAIDLLTNAELNAALNSDIEEYSLDDGQVKIRTVYRDPNQILKAIEVLERQKQRILNQLNGRITRHVDSENLKRRQWPFQR